MKRILLVVLCFLTFPVAASHIVGGEFEILHVSENNYRINLILYFDELNGNPDARDGNVDARIFRMRDNGVVRDISLPLVSQTPVSYTQPECSHGEIVTTKLIYSTLVTLSPNIYDEPEGYYIAWERCCRNYTITNVQSNDPTQGQFAGQTFYLEFPPVVKNGQPFIDSTPRLFPPLNDYACPNRPYYVDFAGVDDDGDSLVYSLVTPLNTKSGEAVPENGPRPRPYPDVVWRYPFNLSNVMNGHPDLKVNADGFITVTPTTQGLFVFAVKCEEFRDGVKIGEVRRDFQMLVVDRCPQAEPPQILGKKSSDESFSYDNNMNVSFTNSVIDEERCIQVQVSDPDASKADENYSERINIKVIPIGFKKDISEILPDVTSATLINGSTKVFDICFPECPYVNGPYEIGVVAYDDACSLPLYDTLKVTVNVQPPPNANPYFITPDVTATLNEGQTQTWAIQARDDDGDQLVVGLIPIGFNLQDAGMTFTIVNQANGLVNAQLQWDAYCDIYDFTKRTEFDVMVVVEDIDKCLISTPDVMRLQLKINFPPNHPPIIDSDLTDDPAERIVAGIKRQIYESLVFNVTGKDGDNDLIVLDVHGVGFNIDDYNIMFEPAAGNGLVTSQFRWDINCDKLNLQQKNVYDFQFVVVDNVNKCNFYRADTLDVLVELEPPPNTPPDILVSSLNESQRLINNSMTVKLGEQINLGLYGNDSDNFPDQDFLRLELIDAEGSVPPEGYVFVPAEGKGSIETTFSWNPDCSIFQNGVYENLYQFTFRVYDSRCFNSLADTVKVDITIKDVESDVESFNPSNFISPNGDNCNDYFALEGIDPGDPTSGCYNPEPDAVVSLPKDNCIRWFESIRIYNRWGGMVFESNSRDFRWYASGEPNGVYYYRLKYSDREYKGTVTVRY
ncbi:MAG TPA: gliding motility-associated C-terminal domain-containing protein [Cyclobacteriaceae bacterium]|nr:gliding motility-associated C-terminal domain-containing protein [Cyclobacteriaceae bacterium]